MNSAHVFPDAATNVKLERAGAAAAWYWVCSILFCRGRQEQRAVRGDEPIDFIPERNSLQLFADTAAKDYVKALVREKLWHRVDGGYRVNDFEKVYGSLSAGSAPSSQPAPAGPADTSQKPADTPPAGPEASRPTPSQLGGMRRAAASRTPGGTFQPSLLAGLPVSPTPPSDPEDPKKHGKEGDSEENQPDSKRSGAGARGKRARATSLPAGFGLTAEHIAFGATKDWPEWWMRDRCEQFCDLAAAKGWTYKDWKLALYTFLRNEISWGRGPAAIGRFQGTGSQPNAAGFQRGPEQSPRAGDQLGKQLRRIEDMSQAASAPVAKAALT